MATAGSSGRTLRPNGRSPLAVRGVHRCQPAHTQLTRQPCGWGEACRWSRCGRRCAITALGQADNGGTATTRRRGTGARPPRGHSPPVASSPGRATARSIEAPAGFARLAVRSKLAFGGEAHWWGSREPVDSRIEPAGADDVRFAHRGVAAGDDAWATAADLSTAAVGVGCGGRASSGLRVSTRDSHAPRRMQTALVPRVGRRTVPACRAGRCDGSWSEGEWSGAAVRHDGAWSRWRTGQTGEAEAACLLGDGPSERRHQASGPPRAAGRSTGNMPTGRAVSCERAAVSRPGR